MKEPAETREEAKDSRGFGNYVLWACVVLVLYVLSSGPFLRMFTNGTFKHGTVAYSVTDITYLPLVYASTHISLGKPLRMYFHLWCPDRYDKNGDVPKPK